MELRESLEVKIRLFPASGPSEGPFKASLRDRVLTVVGGPDAVTAGDIIITTDASNRQQRYVVVRGEHRSGLLNIPDNWRIDVRVDRSPRNRTVKQADILAHNADLVPVGKTTLEDVSRLITNLVQEIERSHASTFDKNEAKSLLFRVFNDRPLQKTLGRKATAIRQLIMNINASGGGT